MRTYKLTITYDGTRYRGWQRQPDTDMTIQNIMEKAVSEVTGYKVEIDGSGRTDGGVHAFGQTASVRIAGKIEEKEFRDKINEHLPEDIKVTETKLMKNSFHARYSAVSKCYEYHIDQRERPDVFARKYCHHCPGKLDIEAMEEAAGYLTGKHDFTSFCDRKGEEDKSFVRTIYDIEIQTEGEKITIVYKGNGFLYHMVRILTGTIIEVGAGERKAEEIPAVLEAKQRSLAGQLVPANGLFLKEVYYE